jgi:thioredoxin 1
MNRLLLLSGISVILLFNNCSAGNPESNKTTVANAKVANIIYLTNETFQTEIFNYQVNKEWKYEGDMPAIIDFYASWCGPCRVLSPIIEEIAKEYDGKIIVYKVDTDAQQQLAQNLGISSLPTLLFIPVNGQPQAAMGALPKESIVQAINEVLLTN